MSIHDLFEELKADVSKLYNKFQDNTVVHTVEVDAKAIGASALDYIEKQGLTALYNIATAALQGAVTGTTWAMIGATVVAQGEAAGIAIAKGAESIVLAQAQADLIAAGKLISPTTGTTV